MGEWGNQEWDLGIHHEVYHRVSFRVFREFYLLQPSHNIL